MASIFNNGMLNDDELERLKNFRDWMNAFRSSNPVNPWGSPSTYPQQSISPTDSRSKGVYEYQEPEVDEQGTYYGYKILHRHCERSECWGMMSPNYPAHWSESGELEADHKPDAHTMFGIHCTKTPYHSELRKYIRDDGMRYKMYGEDIELWFLVKCALSGKIVETEQGFRAQHAQIIGVYSNGNWQSYQDYRERAQANSRQNPYPYQDWTRGNWRPSDAPNP